MKQFVNLKNTLLSIVIAGAFFVPGFASAGCDGAYWGVNTGSSSSLAGLVVATSNNGAVQNMTINIHGGGAGINRLNSSYSVAQTLYDATWGTGSVYYSATQSAACYTTGYLVLGYGSSNSQGNTYALDCKNSAGAYNQFYVQMASANPTAYGYWDYAISGQHAVDAAYHVRSSVDNVNPILYFSVNNGYTTWVTFNWIPQSPPSYNLTVNINPAGAATATGAGSYANGASATAGYTNVSSSYLFSSWSGDAGCGSAMTMNGNKTCTANFTLRPASISCTATPEDGLAPLVVKVTTTYANLIANPTFTYDFGSAQGESTLSGKPAVVYYTYSKGGSYAIKVTSTSNAGASISANCTPAAVVVTAPSGSSGGEVRPQYYK